MYADAAELESKTGRIALQPAEEELLASIELDAMKLRDDHARYLANADRVEELVELLRAREAFPEPRVQYLTNPEHKPGPAKGSRMDILRRNHRLDGSVFRNPAFLKYLRYLVNGADLPKGLIKVFCAAVADCGYVSSGDVEGLRKNVRHLVREYRLNGSEAADEFYKLALDCEMAPHYADSMRRAAMQVR